MGNEFALNKNEKWFNAKNPHGSHVLGTVGAIWGNDFGIVGMVKNPNVCYIICRVFGDE